MSAANQTLLEELQNINPKTIKNNLFQNLDINAYCFNVHDTDTISILFKYKDEIVKYNIRLSGIDAPELHSKVLYESELCIKGTEYLKSLVLNKIINVKTYNIDKYGRMLGDIYTINLNNNIHINKELISQGYCREYNGEAKTDWNLINSNQLHLQNIENINNTTVTMPCINDANVNSNVISESNIDIVKPRRRYIRKRKAIQ